MNVVRALATIQPDAEVDLRGPACKPGGDVLDELLRLRSRLFDREAAQTLRPQARQFVRYVPMLSEVTQPRPPPRREPGSSELRIQVA